MGLFSKAKPAPPVFTPVNTLDPSLAERLPTDSFTGAPLPPTQQPGYYPGFSTLSQKKYWESTTRGVVENRVKTTPVRSFFTQAEFDFWTVVFDHLLPQTDRTSDRQIPLVAPLDERLAKNETDGYRYEDMPEDRVAYKIGIEAIQAEARARFSGDFLSLPYRHQDLVLEGLHDGEPQSDSEIWQRMSVSRFWELILSDAVKAYYAHPWSWDEIGFGGPAYPRAYTRLERGEAEPWEVNEQRYEWEPPSVSVSGKVHPMTEGESDSRQKNGSRTKRSQ